MLKVYSLLCFIFGLIPSDGVLNLVSEELTRVMSERISIQVVVSGHEISQRDLLPSVMIDVLHLIINVVQNRGDLADQRIVVV